MLEKHLNPFKDNAATRTRCSLCRAHKILNSKKKRTNSNETKRKKEEKKGAKWLQDVALYVKSPSQKE